MIDLNYVKCMARYNRWQNANCFETADHLPAAERERERGAFFGSIHKTLSHLLWADRLWMSRFRGLPRPSGTIPESIDAFPDWQQQRKYRTALDAEIIDWADSLKPQWLAGELTYYSQSAGRDLGGPRWLLVTHFFNHQTHHRGQVHCLLTQAGARPQDTDLQLIPNLGR